MATNSTGVTMQISTNKKLSERLNDLTQDAVDKAIENHRQKGESIAISDKQGKVKVISASEIPNLKRKKEVV
ncbi:MAG: hypothetical protein AAGF26_10845 [Cyanobacteria bacterium P01_G01_bin.49]